MQNTPVLMFYKAGNDLAQIAADDLLQAIPEAIIIPADRNQPFPESRIRDIQPDYLISYICPWIIPAWCLQQARLAAINFHPGPPEYPGTGCTNFAIYDESPRFGVTCHHMLPGVDSGNIIAVERFPLLASDSVQSLTLRCYGAIYRLFSSILEAITANAPLPTSPETWQRKPFTRKMLNELCRLNPDMTADEVNRRIRATTFPGAPGPYLEWQGHRFSHQERSSQ